MLFRSLTKTRVDRPPKKPKRLSRDELARRVAKHRSGKALSTTDNALARSDLATCSHCADTTMASRVSTPTVTTTRAPPRTKVLPTTAPLASTAEVVIMQSVVAQRSPSRKPCSPSQTLTSVQRERTILSWLRRPITLLISLLKAANIS